MDIYKTELAVKLFPGIIIRDINGIDVDFVVYPDPRELCYNEFWIKFYDPESIGLSKESILIFSYDSSINKASDIDKMFDIIHGKCVQTTLDEDIRLAILLYNYAGKDRYLAFVSNKGIDETIAIEDISEMNNEEIIMTYVLDTVRWREIGLSDDYKAHPKDKYDVYVKEHHQNDYPVLTMYLNRRIVMPYLNDEFFNHFGLQENDVKLTTDIIENNKYPEQIYIIRNLEDLILKYKLFRRKPYYYIFDNIPEEKFIEEFITDEGKEILHNW